MKIIRFRSLNHWILAAILRWGWLLLLKNPWSRGVERIWGYPLSGNRWQSTSNLAKMPISSAKFQTGESLQVFTSSCKAWHFPMEAWDMLRLFSCDLVENWYLNSGVCKVKIIKVYGKMDAKYTFRKGQQPVDWGNGGQDRIWMHGFTVLVGSNCQHWNLKFKWKHNFESFDVSSHVMTIRHQLVIM